LTRSRDAPASGECCRGETRRAVASTSEDLGLLTLDEPTRPRSEDLLLLISQVTRENETRRAVASASEDLGLLAVDIDEPTRPRSEDLLLLISGRNEGEYILYSF